MCVYVRFDKIDNDLITRLTIEYRVMLKNEATSDYYAKLDRN